jgi:hypothetical protein
MDEVLAVHSQEYAKLVMAVAEEKSPDEVHTRNGTSFSSPFASVKIFAFIDVLIS